MTSKIALALVTIMFMRITLAIQYSSTMLDQKIMYFENPLVELDVKYYGEEGYAYLKLNDVIDHYNDLHLMLYAKNRDPEQTPILLAHAPMSICQLLYDQYVLKTVNETVSQFNIPQMFNLVGKTCPLEQKHLRLSPYIFPANFTIDAKLDCGYTNVEARLMKCGEELENDLRKCNTLIKTTLVVFFNNDECHMDNNVNVQTITDGWIMEKIQQ